MSSTEEFLNLPRPPSTVPPEGSVGLVEAAAAAGPRYRPGSAVWVAPPGAGQAPVRGTVGQLVSADGGAGGQALYKVRGQGRGQAVMRGGRLSMLWMLTCGPSENWQPGGVCMVNGGWVVQDRVGH